VKFKVFGVNITSCTSQRRIASIQSSGNHVFFPFGIWVLGGGNNASWGNIASPNIVSLSNILGFALQHFPVVNLCLAVNLCLVVNCHTERFLQFAKGL
jgi:hypothetical protein